MKKPKGLLCVCLFLSIAAAGCSGKAKSPENKEVQQVKAEYQCPMKCSDQKFDKPGKCPQCGMELEKVANS